VQQREELRSLRHDFTEAGASAFAKVWDNPRDAIYDAIWVWRCGITDWRTAGLLRPSVVKPIFATFEEAVVRRRLGTLTSSDLAALQKFIAAVLVRGCF
jgi:hypothetical protein